MATIKRLSALSGAIGTRVGKDGRMPDNFTQIPFTVENLDLYFIRKSIFLSLQKNLKFFSGKVLDYGCGKMPYKRYILENSDVTEYVGLDIKAHLNYGNISPDITWDGKTIPLPDNSIETLLATEVFEHIRDLEHALIEMYRVLKKGGMIFFTTPYLWTLHDVPHDECRYTPFALERHLSKAGFKEIEIKPLGGWNASLAQMLGLWVRRKPMGRLRRALLSSLLKPIIKTLIKRDRAPDEYREGQMITGLYGTAKK